MSVLIQQVTLRQVKALSKRLQVVIPEVLATGPVSLSQAQAIAAKGLGHADFHAAQRFHREDEADPRPRTAPSPLLDGVLTGPPEVMIETLMQHLGRHHEPTWPHWRQRRRMIAMVVHAAWAASWGASLTPQQLLVEIPQDAFRIRVLARHVEEAQIYLDRLPGPLIQDHFNDEATFLHWLNVADWTRVLTDLSQGVAPPPRDWAEAQVSFQRLLHRPYPHSPTLTGSARAIMQELGAELEQVLRAFGHDPIWARRGFDLVQAVVHGLLRMDLPDRRLTRAHVLDALALPHLAVMAHDKSPLMDQRRDTVRLYLKILPGYQTDFSRTERLGPPFPVLGLTATQHQHQLHMWSVLLRRTEES